jgi:hypothetical protein
LPPFILATPKSMSKNIDKRLWGVLGKQQTFYSPQKQVQGKTKVPLNANAFDSWDVKRSRFKRVDGYENAVQQGGVVPQVSSSPSVITPTPTPSITPSPTPSLTPTMTPSITPSSTPYPLPINPSLWFDASDSSTMSLINSGGTDYVSTWNSKGTTTWSLSGTNTNRMPIFSASTLMPGNPNCVRFTANATAALQDGMMSFGNTPITHTGSTWFVVWAKPDGSLYTQSPLLNRVYSGFTNGGLITSGSPGGGIDNHSFNITNGNILTNTYNLYMNQAYGLNLPVYSAANLNSKFIVSYNNPGSTGGFSYVEINQSAQTNTTAFTGATSVGEVNSYVMGLTVASAGTQTYGNANVELCEVMWFNTELTPAEREQVELYLKDKWRYDEWASPVPTATPTASPTQTATMTNTPTPSPTPPFNPLNLNPMIWVDFNDASTLSLRSGQYVQSVSNKGNWTAFTGFSQTTASDQPSWSASTMGTGMSAITISNNFLNAPQVLTGSAWNTFVVLKFSGTNEFQPIKISGTIGGQNSAWSNVYAQPGSNRYANFFIQFASNYRAGFSDYTSYSTPHILQSYLSNSSTTIIDYMTINNSAQTETNISNSVISTGAPGSISGIFRIINEDGIYSDISGEIGEIYMFDKELTSTQQSNLINYLKTKWGIA